MSNFQIKTKNQFKETTRYLQEKLSKELGQDIKLSSIQEAVSRSMGYTDMQHYMSVLKIMQTTPANAEYANGDITKEIQSLNFLIKTAEGGSRTQDHVKSVLLHMYNSTNPIELFRIKGYDQEHKIHMMNVMALDSRYGKEIHEYIDRGSELFHRWANEAHQNRETSKYKDNLYKFCETVESMKRVENKNNKFLDLLKHEWNNTMPDMKSSIDIIDLVKDGHYCAKLLAVDRFEYEYSVSIRFNLIDGYIYICEESSINEPCKSMLIYSTVDQEELEQMQEDEEINYRSRNYFC